MIQGTASEAVLVALLAARDKVLRRIGKEALGNLVVYCSDQTHSAIQKACQVKTVYIVFKKRTMHQFFLDKSQKIHSSRPKEQKNSACYIR